MTTYHRPTTLDDALAILAAGEARVAAGCTDLFPATERKRLPGAVLDITGIGALRGIDRDEAGFRIGAATRWSEIAGADLPPAFDMLRAAARDVGSIQIQNAGTIGGNLCNASPAADGVPCLMALDATVDIAGPDGARSLPLDRFLTGPRQTALAPGEILTAVRVPARAVRGQSRFLKLGARKYLVISIAMVAARLVVEDDRIARAAISVGACGPVAARLSALEAALTGAVLGNAAAEVTRTRVADALSPIDDIRATATYRLHAATELTRRAIADLTGEMGA